MSTVSKALIERNAKFRQSAPKHELRLLPQPAPQVIEGWLRMNWWEAVVKSGRLTTTAEVSVLGVILAHIHMQDGDAWPSLNTIARYAKCDKRTVKKAIERLIECGFVAKSSPGKNGR